MELLVLLGFVGLLAWPFLAIRRERNRAIAEARALPREDRMAYVTAYNTGKMVHRTINIQEVMDV